MLLKARTQISCTESNYGKFTFKYRAALIWETIPKELKSLNSFAFKRNCKTFLLQNQ